MKNNLTLKNYLQGDQDNLFGTILGFRKNIVHSETFNTSVKFSFFIFFDHRTGKIERYLINSGITEENTDIQKTNNDIFVFNNVKYNLLNEMEHISNNEVLSFVKLNNGALTRRFFMLFLLELVRDYFVFERSFNLGNMKVLREKTLPLIKADNNNNESIKTPGIGTETILTKNLKSIDSTHYIKLDRSKPKIINIPKNFINERLNDSLKPFNMILNPINFDDSPQCIKDLKRTINIKDFNSSKDLNRKIKLFNHNIIFFIYSIYIN